MTRDEELAALRRPFALGAAACLAAIVCLGGIIAAFGQTDVDRPAGVAERWLTAASDLTREGVDADALERLSELSDGFAPDPIALFPSAAAVATAEGRALFETIQVGRALDGSTGPVEIPALVTPRDAEDTVALLVLVVPRDDTWAVTDLARCDVDAPCPAGFPLERTERAPLGWWLGALLAGLAIAAGCTAAIGAATPSRS